MHHGTGGEREGMREQRKAKELEIDTRKFVEKKLERMCQQFQRRH